MDIKKELLGIIEALSEKIVEDFGEKPEDLIDEMLCDSYCQTEEEASDLLLEDSVALWAYFKLTLISSRMDDQPNDTDLPTFGNWQLVLPSSPPPYQTVLAWRDGDLFPVVAYRAIVDVTGLPEKRAWFAKDSGLQVTAGDKPWRPTHWASVLPARMVQEGK